MRIDRESKNHGQYILLKKAQNKTDCREDLKGTSARWVKVLFKSFKKHLNADGVNELNNLMGRDSFSLGPTSQ